MIAIDIKHSEPGSPRCEIAITLDDQGLSSLLAQLGFLKQRKTDHVDLMSSEWGGNHLCGISQTPDSDPAHYVKIVLREP